MYGGRSQPRVFAPPVSISALAHGLCNSDARLRSPLHHRHASAAEAVENGGDLCTIMMDGGFSQNPVFGQMRAQTVRECSTFISATLLRDARILLSHFGAKIYTSVLRGTRKETISGPSAFDRGKPKRELTSVLWGKMWRNVHRLFYGAHIFYCGSSKACVLLV